MFKVECFRVEEMINVIVCAASTDEQKWVMGFVCTAVPSFGTVQLVLAMICSAEVYLLSSLWEMRQHQPITTSLEFYVPGTNLLLTLSAVVLHLILSVGLWDSEPLIVGLSDRLVMLALNCVGLTKTNNQLYEESNEEQALYFNLHPS